MLGSIGPNLFGRPRYNSGWGHNTIRDMWITIRFTRYSLNKIIDCKQLILVFWLHFLVSLAWNTTGVTTTTTMAAAGRNGLQASHMRPCAPRRCFEWMGDSPPSLQMYFLSKLRLCMALKVHICSGNGKSPQHWSVLRAIHTLNSPPNYIH